MCRYRRGRDETGARGPEALTARVPGAVTTSRDEDLRVVDRLHEEVDDAADGGAGRPAPDDLQVEEQGGIERPDDDPADVHVLGDPEDPRGDAGPRCHRPQHRLRTVDQIRL